ncbi:hypothetical protein FKM82_010181 [Ascaphus truei]
MILSFNYIMELNATSFPLLWRLLILEIGTQHTNSLSIRKHSFRSLPNLVQLDLAGNKMLILDPEAFVGLSNVKNLLLYFNRLNVSILENDYFKDLTSLEYLDLSKNQITYLRPNPLFYRLYNFQILDLQLNQISSICEGDLHSFQRKYFVVMDISSNHLYSSETIIWDRCGNPFRNINLDTLILSGNGFNVDKTQKICNALNGTRMAQLKLSSHGMGASFGFNNLKDPDNSTFAGLINSDLQILDLSVGDIFSLNPYTFANLTKVELLILTSNKINRIEKYAFYGLQSLRILNLSHNLLGEIYNYAFDGLANVTYIDLQQNHIGPIQRYAFKQLTYLETVDLRDNAIKTITFCEAMPFTGYILLGGNKLKSINSGKLSTTFIDLTGNQLKNLGDLYKLLQFPLLKYIILKQNSLSSCYKYSNISKDNSLVHLDLSENMIQLIWKNELCLDMFRQLSKLEVLRLSNNYLSFLPDGIFNGLTSLQSLNLSSNLLTHLFPGVFPTNVATVDLSKNQLLSPSPEVFASLSVLDITDNQYICDCTLSSLIIWLNETNITLLGSPDNIYCVFPDPYFHVALHTISVDNCNEDIVLKPLMFALFVLTSLTIITFMTSVIVYTHFRGFCFTLYMRIIGLIVDGQKEEGHAEMCKYDAYLCYSNKDFQWVQNAFLKSLDSQYCDKNRFHLCFEERDFIPGEDHIVNIRDAIWNSNKTICIVTKQFLKDGWCVEAFNYAQSRYFSDLKDVLIMIVVGSLSQYQLKRYKPIRAFVQRRQYLKWPEDNQDIDWFLRRLSHQILKEQKVEEKEIKVTKTATSVELQNIATVS